MCSCRRHIMMTAPQNDVMTSTPWIQAYDPLASPWLSTAAAALPIVLLLVALAVLEWRAHVAAFTGLVAALGIATLEFGMPFSAAAATAVYGAAYGFLPIGWIVLNAVFLYELTVATGQFQVLRVSVGQLSRDRLVQALLVAFSFGAFIEGACGFGAPIAICSALLIGLGFTPLYAAGLSLIANTAPVAFGSIGIPILTLASVTDMPAHILGKMAGRQLPFVSLIIPIWLVATMSGRRGLRGVWPAVLERGGGDDRSHRGAPRLDAVAVSQRCGDRLGHDAGEGRAERQPDPCAALER